MNFYSPKYIQSLKNKKDRKATGLFVVEGTKSILELANSTYEIECIYCTHEVYAENEDILEKKKPIIKLVSEGEIAKMSSLEFNNTGIAVAKQKPNTPFAIEENDLILALDTIRDPGNLGTIIRTADWYGITKIICGDTTADLYNNKTIASSMGSFTRVHTYYGNIEKFIRESSLPVLGATLDGKNIHNVSFPKTGILVLGNEANGIDSSLLPFVTEKITIPSYGTAESLNVSIATGIILDCWKNSL